MAPRGIQAAVLLDRRLSPERPRPFARHLGRIGMLPWVAAILTLAVHLAGNPHYGFFRDELYFIVCGFHPALGYVDQPPLTPLLAAFSQSLGLSLFALRAVPAFFAAVATYAACLVAAELGGGTFALALTALVTVVAPEMMSFGMRLSPDTIEYSVWPLVALLALRITRGADARWWLAVGALVAFAGWAKYSVAFFAVALVAALLVTRERRVLRTPWFFGGVALCIALIAPNAWWQWHHQFPMLQILRNDYGKFLLVHPPFPLQQFIVMSPLLSLEWVIGLGWLLWRRDLRFLGIAYLALIAMMWALDAKNYYPAPVYPYLIAAGAVPIAAWTQRRRVWRAAIVAIVVLFAIPATPFVLPVLPLPAYIRYQQTLGRAFGIRFHVGKTGNSVPIQYYADMTGWHGLTRAVASIYQALPPAERAHAVIYAHNFGEASAIQLFGAAYDLPPVVSGNNNFWIWGPQGRSGNVLIDVNDRKLANRHYFRSVERLQTFHSRYAMPYENDIPIYLCRGIRRPLPRLWPQLRNYSYAFKGL